MGASSRHDAHQRTTICCFVRHRWFTNSRALTAFHDCIADAAEPERNGEESFGQWKFGSGAYTDNEVGMAWTQQHVRMFADGAPSIGLNISDMLLLPRHVWAGSWHYGAALWSGDIVSAFSELELQIRAVQGVVMSGQVRRQQCCLLHSFANGDTDEIDAAHDTVAALCLQVLWTTDIGGYAYVAAACSIAVAHSRCLRL